MPYFNCGESRRLRRIDDPLNQSRDLTNLVLPGRSLGAASST